MPNSPKRPKPWLEGLVWAITLWLGLATAALAQTTGADIKRLKAERAEDGTVLAATVQIDLPGAIEEALLKGVPVFFVAEVDITRDRWYWTDQRVLSASRSWRLAYQPLSRRWRMTVSSGSAALTQNFDTLTDALATMGRINRWRVAEPNVLDADGKYMVSFKFRLDTTQLPRPFQIGLVGQGGWNVATERSVRLGAP